MFKDKVIRVSLSLLSSTTPALTRVGSWSRCFASSRQLPSVSSSASSRQTSALLNFTPRLLSPTLFLCGGFFFGFSLLWVLGRCTGKTFNSLLLLPANTAGTASPNHPSLSEAVAVVNLVSSNHLRSWLQRATFSILQEEKSHVPAVTVISYDR